uniref:Uncharacterized protein LOC114341095 n=1 Tax=Diabrotica virgifera virgifera TaxID=50390 RepID=A0A6P7GUZ5_DIAVI
MECGVQSAMLSVPPVGESGVQQSLPAVYSPTDADQAQFEADKRAVYKHPLFPLLALLFERCELATQSSDTQSSDAFNLDIQAFVQHQERDRKPFLANEPEIDGLLLKYRHYYMCLWVLKKEKKDIATPTETFKAYILLHPLFPLLALLFERCELATQSSDTQSSDAFNLDIQAFVQHQERDRKPFLANEPEIDGL